MLISLLEILGPRKKSDISSLVANRNRSYLDFNFILSQYTSLIQSFRLRPISDLSVYAVEIK